MNNVPNQGVSAAATQDTVLPGAAGGYQRTKVGDVSRALTELFIGLQGEDNSYTRASSTNVLLPLGSADAAEAVESLVEEVARLHPSRFFLCGVNNALNALAAEVSARCHFTSKGAGRAQHVCSELVRFGVPNSQLAALAQAVRANLVSGTPTELFLFDSRVEGELLDALLPLVDDLVLDSSMWSERVFLLEKMLSSARHVVDLQWIALGPWRELLRSAFAIPEARGLANGISRVQVITDASLGAARGGATERRSVSEGALPRGATMAGLLLHGWIASRLHLTPTSVRDDEEGSGIQLMSSMPTGASVSSSVASVGEAAVSPPRWLASGEATGPTVRSVRIEGIGRGGRSTSIEIQRSGGLLEAKVRGNSSVVLTRPIEKEEGIDFLRRFFLIGESVTNYPAAMSEVCRVCAFVAD